MKDMGIIYVTLMSQKLYPSEEAVLFYHQKYEKYINLDRPDLLFDLLKQDGVVDDCKEINEDVKCLVMFMMDQQPSMRASCEDVLVFVKQIQDSE